MREFFFVGRVPCSKSLLNRALILQSYEPKLVIKGDSEAEDVIKMKEGLKALLSDQPVDCGSAGTVLRFLALRAARVKGQHLLKGTPRLFSRPMDELVGLLSQLGSEVNIFEDHMIIKSQGFFVMGDMINVRSERSSQFLSSLLLNCWDLDFDMFVNMGSQIASKAYFEMTYQMCEKAGLKPFRKQNELMLAKNQKIIPQELVIESDLSSAFALCACAAVGGSATLIDFPSLSLQPDRLFVMVLKMMGVGVESHGNQLKITKADTLVGVDVNLYDAPDLFPVLASLCALAEGSSRLFGAPQLNFKESNRIQKTAELLRPLRPSLEVQHDGIYFPQEKLQKLTQQIEFNPDQDHRMAMAAGVLIQAGYPVHITEPSVVIKSFPQFWSFLT